MDWSFRRAAADKRRLEVFLRGRSAAANVPGRRPFEPTVLRPLVSCLRGFALSPSGDTRGVKHVFRWAVWWVALFWLWLLLVGAWNREQVVAAAIAATPAASLAEFARARTELGAPLPWRVLAAVPPALGMVLVDFGIVMWALVAGIARRRIVRGGFVSRELPGGSWLTRGTGSRAWTVLVASYSPNAYVVDVDPAARRVLLHDLIRYRRSEEPV
jgi:hypothetical protein